MGSAPINRNTNPLSPLPAPPSYHPAFDRTPSTVLGESWRTNAPNGSVSIQDITLAVQSFGHNCV